MYRRKVAALLIAIGIIYSAYISFNAVLCKSIESRLTRTLGLKTKIGSFRLIPWRDTITIDKLSIANPEGFSSKALFTIKECAASVKLSTLTQDIIFIEELKLRGISINVEHNKKYLNLDSLKHTVRQHNADTEKNEADKPEQKGTAQKKRFRINHLKAKNNEVAFASTSMGLKAIHFKVPAVEIEDLSGPDGRAVTIDEILYKLICAVIDKLAAQGPANYQKEIKKFLMDQLENYYKK